MSGFPRSRGKRPKGKWGANIIPTPLTSFPPRHRHSGESRNPGVDGRNGRGGSVTRPSPSRSVRGRGAKRTQGMPAEAGNLNPPPTQIANHHVKPTPPPPSFRRKPALQRTKHPSRSAGRQRHPTPLTVGAGFKPARERANAGACPGLDPGVRVNPAPFAKRKGREPAKRRERDMPAEAGNPNPPPTQIATYHTGSSARPVPRLRTGFVIDPVPRSRKTPPVSYRFLPR